MSTDKKTLNKIILSCNSQLPIKQSLNAHGSVGTLCGMGPHVFWVERVCRHLSETDP